MWGGREWCFPPLPVTRLPLPGRPQRYAGAEPPPGGLRERRSVPPPPVPFGWAEGAAYPLSSPTLPPPLPHQVSPLRRAVLSSAATSVRWVSRSAAPPSAIFSPRQQRRRRRRRQRQQGQERAALHAGSDAGRETPSPPSPFPQSAGRGPRVTWRAAAPPSGQEVLPFSTRNGRACAPPRRGGSLLRPVGDLGRPLPFSDSGVWGRGTVSRQAGSSAGVRVPAAAQARCAAAPAGRRPPARVRGYLRWLERP